MAEVVPADRFAKLPERYQRRAREIARRVGEIDALRRPATPDQIGAVVIRMRHQLRPQPDTEPADMAQGFRDACRDLPDWALSEAASDFLAGRVENHTGQFMPACAEFAKRARSIMVPFLAERAALCVEAAKLVERAADEANRLRVEAERRDPRVRERVAALLAGFTADAPKRNALTHGMSGEARARLDAMKPKREYPSKIGQTRIARSEFKKAE